MKIIIIHWNNAEDEQSKQTIKNIAQHSAEHYRQHWKQFIEKNMMRKKYIDFTKKNIFTMLTKQTK